MSISKKKNNSPIIDVELFKTNKMKANELRIGNYYLDEYCLMPD